MRRLRARTRLAMRSPAAGSGTRPHAVASAGRPARAAHLGDRHRRRTCHGRDVTGSTSPVSRAGSCSRRRTASDVVTLTTERLRAVIRLAPFGIAWQQPVGRTGSPSAPIARPTRTPRCSARRASCTAWRATRSDHYFGLGDKTGPLDKHGRRLRTLQLDALGYDGEDERPAVQALADVPRRDAAIRACATACSTTRCPSARSISGRSTTTITVSIASTRDRGRRSRLLRVRRARPSPTCARALRAARSAAPRFRRAGRSASRTRRWASPTRRTRRRSSQHFIGTCAARTHSALGVSLRLRLHAAAASGATCSPGIATSFPSRRRSRARFRRPASAWWPTSSPACSTIIRPTRSRRGKARS